jgi:hypothetical protein
MDFVTRVPPNVHRVYVDAIIPTLEGICDDVTQRFFLAQLMNPAIREFTHQVLLNLVLRLQQATAWQ